LGRDEVYAWVISTAATFAASALLPRVAGGLSAGAYALILALVGPVAEKGGLFVHYFRGAFREFRRAEPGERRALRHYVAKAIRAGWPSLRADLLYHDPTYTVLLWVLLRVTGSQGMVGATLLAGVSFVAAVAIASALDVLWVDLMYALLHWRLRRAGFVTKSYYEARFLVDPEGDDTFSPQNTLDRLQAHFNLPVRTTHLYRDVYLTAHSLAVYNGRRPYLRFRQRTDEDGSVSKQAVQVMYARAREVRTGSLSLYRCFTTLKQKSGFDFPLEEPMPWRTDQIVDGEVARIVGRLSSTNEHREIKFRRHVAMDPHGLFVSVDIPPQSPAPTGAYWLEVKSRHDVEALRGASDYIAWKLPVRATTQMKCEPLWRAGTAGSNTATTTATAPSRPACRRC
jgi:hypothetical protein